MPQRNQQNDDRQWKISNVIQSIDLELQEIACPALFSLACPAFLVELIL